MEYLFVAITPYIHSDLDWLYLFESNRSVWKLLVLNKNTSNHITSCEFLALNILSGVDRLLNKQKQVDLLQYSHYFCYSWWHYLQGHWPMSRVFANGPVDQGSIPGQVMPKTQKMVLNATLLTQHYKVRIKVKVEQSREWSSAFPSTSV